MTLKKGDKFSKVSARNLNKLDNLPDNFGQTIPRDVETTARDGIILVRNKSGLHLDRGSVVGLKEATLDPTADEYLWRSAMLMDAVVPTGGEATGSSEEPTEDYRGRFAILLEPLGSSEADTAAAAVCGGPYVAVVYVGREGQKFADIYPGQTMALKSADAGAAQILHVEPGTGLRKAYVRLGNVFSGIRCARFTEAMTDDNPEAEAHVWEFDPTAGEAEEGEEPPGDFVETEEKVRLRSFLRPVGVDIDERTRCHFARMGIVDVAFVTNCDADPEEESEE